MPALPPASDFTGAANQAVAQTAYASQRSFLAGLLGTDGLPGTALSNLGALGSTHVAKTAAYTVVAGDLGRVINATGGTWTLSTIAAATAGNGFAFLILNSGTGVITINPNGSEQINGLTSEDLPPGAGMLVVCNGTKWFGFEMPGGAQKSAIDGTAGTVLRLYTNGGSFGLGNTGLLQDIGNLDATNIPAGTYLMSSSTTGTRPPLVGGSAAGSVEVKVHSTISIQQSLRVNNPAVGLAGIYTRQYFSGAWTAWDNTVMRTEIIGTVAQTGGIATGSVVERGSNANGEYVKHADGTMICTRGTLSAANASTALGSLFRSADVAWTFPAAFINTTHLVVSGDVDDADSWLSANTVTTTGCNLRALAGATKAGALTLRAMAVGRWF